MDILNKKESFISKSLFTLTLFIILLRRYIVFNLEPNSAIEKASSLLFYTSIALLILQFILIRKHNITELVIFFTSCALYVFTREGSILVLILLAISIRNINDKYVAKNYLLMNVIFIIVFILIGNLLPEIIKNLVVHYRMQNGVPVARESFGLHNPNLMFFYSISVYVAYIFLRFDKYNMVDRLILLGTTLFIYKETLSRTGLLTMIAGLVFVDILKYIDLKKYSKLSMGIKILPIIFLIGSVFLGTMLSKVTILNKLLASRPKFWNVYLMQEGNFLSLFGNKYSSAIKQANPLDNSYVYVTVMLGIVSVIFFMYLLYKGLDLLIQKNEKKYIAIIVMFLIYSFAENILFEAGFNFTIILLIKHIIIDNPLKNKFRRENKC